jgi:hypothetical protein
MNHYFVENDLSTAFVFTISASALSAIFFHLFYYLFNRKAGDSRRIADISNMDRPSLNRAGWQMLKMRPDKNMSVVLVIILYVFKISFFLLLLSLIYLCYLFFVL